MRSSLSSTAAATKNCTCRRGAEFRPSWVLPEGVSVQNPAAMSTRWSRIKAKPNAVRRRETTITQLQRETPPCVSVVDDVEAIADTTDGLEANAAELPGVHSVADTPDTEEHHQAAPHAQTTSYAKIATGAADKTFAFRKFDGDQAPKRPDGVASGLAVEAELGFSGNAPSYLQLPALCNREPNCVLELCQREELEFSPAKKSYYEPRVGKTYKIMEEYIYYNPNGQLMSCNEMPSQHVEMMSTAPNWDALGNQTRESTSEGEPEPAEARVTVGVDGEIALETSALLRQQDPCTTSSVVFYETSVPEATYSSFRKRSSSKRCWTAEETARFYHALRIFGTDFDLMTTAFPNRTHKNLKNKFKREQRDNRELVQKLINDPTKFNQVAFVDAFSEPNEPEPNPRHV
ncbi:uncharacterized protein [Dermacentor albipictus]|uniref:uncharacterized protein n=1 Tax=Dermacentor albipictus TaxID=60249 RepID=UPI0031FDAE9E